MLSNLLNGAASPANCAKNIPGPLIVLIAPSTPHWRYGAFLARPRRHPRETLLYSFSIPKEISGRVARTINGETNLGAPYAGLRVGLLTLPFLLLASADAVQPAPATAHPAIPTNRPETSP